jgi:hypothetical protein
MGIGADIPGIGNAAGRPPEFGPATQLLQGADVLRQRVLRLHMLLFRAGLLHRLGQVLLLQLGFDMLQRPVLQQRRDLLRFDVLSIGPDLLQRQVLFPRPDLLRFDVLSIGPDLLQRHVLSPRRNLLQRQHLLQRSEHRLLRHNLQTPLLQLRRGLLQREVLRKGPVSEQSLL